MKKFLLLGIVFFVSVSLYAQKCGNYIDLQGIGMYGKSTASISVTDWENVDYIIAEAVYKSYTEPLSIGFTTGDPDTPVDAKLADPVPLDFSGQDPVLLNYVFRAKFDKPAPQVNLNILDNETDFYSFAIYVYRNDGKVYSIKSGELIHVFHNGPDGYTSSIDIPTSDKSRDLFFRFGITELNDDDRWIIFTFEADGVVVKKEVQSYDAAAGVSYIMQTALLENVPGEVDQVSMTMLSRNKSTELPSGDDSFIAGVVLADLPCDEYKSKLLCSFTQGYYGNAGGKTCDGKTTSELLKELLANELVMGLQGSDGKEGNSLSIAAGHVECVLALLPGGGPSSALLGDATCKNPGSMELNKKGRIKNSLLAQGITLSLNTRLSPDLLTFPVDGTEFVTMMARDCYDPEAGGIQGTEKKYAFSPELVNELPGGATIADLLDLVNSALGGEDISPLTLSQVSDAATLVNEAFDECVVVIESSDDLDEEAVKEGGTKGATGVTEDEKDVLGLYPNPANDHIYLRIPSSLSRIKQAAVFCITGEKMMDIEQAFLSGADQVVEIDVSHLNQGIYFVSIETEAGFVNERFGVQ